MWGGRRLPGCVPLGCVEMPVADTTFRALLDLDDAARASSPRRVEDRTRRGTPASPARCSAQPSRSSWPSSGSGSLSRYQSRVGPPELLVVQQPRDEFTVDHLQVDLGRQQRLHLVERELADHPGHVVVMRHPPPQQLLKPAQAGSLAGRSETPPVARTPEPRLLGSSAREAMLADLRQFSRATRQWVRVGTNGSGPAAGHQRRTGGPRRRVPTTACRRSGLLHQ